MKQRVTVAFFCECEWWEADKPTVIWRRKNARCFYKANAATKLALVTHFSNDNSWMQDELIWKGFGTTNPPNDTTE